MQPEPTRPTTCDRCGKPFNTSGVHPRRYCSIACEEGRTPLPEDDPASPGFPNYIQSNPEQLVGKCLFAKGLSLVDYTPDWCKGPNDWSRGTVVSHDPEAKTYVRKTDVCVGHVIGLEDGKYEIHVSEHRIDGSDHYEFYMDSSAVLHQLKQDRWWAE